MIRLRPFIKSSEAIAMEFDKWLGTYNACMIPGQRAPYWLAELKKVLPLSSGPDKDNDNEGRDHGPVFCIWTQHFTFNRDFSLTLVEVLGT